MHKYVDLNFVSGNFTMISRMWKEGINMGIKDRSVAFVCLTNDKNANVTLQYHTDKWNNIMTPSKRYPAGSVLQLGSTFLLKRFEHKHQGGIFKCVAKAHGKEICLLLGALYMSSKCIYYFCQYVKQGCRKQLKH